MKNKLIIILFSEEKEKINYALGMLATAAALERPTELFLTGKSIFSFLNESNNSILNYSNSDELLTLRLVLTFYHHLFLRRLSLQNPVL